LFSLLHFFSGFGGRLRPTARRQPAQKPTLASGVGLAAISSRLMTALLYGFRPGDLPTVPAVSLILLVVAALACFVPARRASRVDRYAETKAGR
jgi:hypothetical protein